MTNNILFIIIGAVIFLIIAIVFVKINKSKSNNKISFTQKNKSFSLSSVFSNTEINENFFASLENTLISSDVGVASTKEIINNLRKAIDENNIKTSDEAKAKLREILLELFTEKSINLEGKNVIFIVGVNGVGKTTTIAKLANLIKKDGSVILAACDTFRAAAIEQLETWANRLNVPIVKGQQAGDPSAILFASLEKAKNDNVDTVIVDTAGRFHNQDNLVRQLEKMKRISTERFPEFNFIPLLILDGNVGHNGIEQAKVFLNSLKIEGVIVTKLDGTCKGGVAIAIAHNLSLPIYYIGYGEKIEDFKTFNTKEFIDSILN